MGYTREVCSVPGIMKVLESTLVIVMIIVHRSVKSQKSTHASPFLSFFFVVLFRMESPTNIAGVHLVAGCCP